MARSKIIRDFISSKMNIDTAIKNLLAILYCLEDESLINWASKELAGYSVNDELPKYRRLQGRVMASFIVGNMKYSKTQFGIFHLDEDLIERLLDTNMYSSIDTLMSMREKEVNLGKPIAPEWFPILQANGVSIIS